MASRTDILGAWPRFDSPRGGVPRRRADRHWHCDLARAGACAVGEQITDVRVLDNQRTEESTVRSIAGISIGDTLEADTLDTVRERLNTTGLFADVNVWWEPHGSGVRVNISVKDKFPWAPVPDRLLVVQQQVDRPAVRPRQPVRPRQAAAARRRASRTIDSGAVARLPRSLAVRQLGLLAAPGGRAAAGHPRVPELGRDAAASRRWPIRRVPRDAPLLLRLRAGLRHRLDAPGEDPGRLAPGEVLTSTTGPDDPARPADRRPSQATKPRHLGLRPRRAELRLPRARVRGHDRRRRSPASVDYGSPGFGSDFTFWRAGAGWEQGIKFFRSHNLIYSVGGVVGHNLPFWNENTAGGTNLRGYLGQQFRGDTQLGGKARVPLPAVLDQLARLPRARVLRRPGGLVPRPADRDRS